ncbi:DUF3999 family protein [Kosakonia sacchari]|uniref:DUF3999 family protein n=1 Tax=Kosakonia sacchari TaxID=1158459 RepID=UPI0015849056|nr:DUF3999 family protein [Kosakonia sacchari]NUL38890.1 DUF3999 family protein [Kosakonia sacchari]
MKKWHGLLLAALVTTAGAAISSEAVPDSPPDYAFGATLDLPQPASWYRVDLPQDTYAQSAWPDLRDVRVFNHDGERVPFTLETQRVTARAPEPIALRVFPLDTSPVDTGTEGQHVVRLHSSSGVDIRIEGEPDEVVGQSYLLAFPENTPENFNLAQLKLAWSEPVKNWRGKVTLFFSSDMRNWTTLQNDAPVMELASGSDRLKLDQINLDQPMPADGVRYLLMVFDTPNLPVTITQVTARPGSEPTPLEQVEMAGHEQRISPTEAQYQWAQPQPLSALSIRLAQEGVLPVSIDWRSSASGEWKALSKTVLWALNGRTSAPLSLPGDAVQAVRITTLDARLPEALPQVTGSRDRQSLVFNAQGKGPFMLAWGNRAAAPVAVTMEGLIPEALRKQLDLTAIPEVLVQDRVALGGEERLTATSPAERQQTWKTVLVWGVLLLGVVVLVWMALRIWREVKTGK